MDFKLAPLPYDYDALEPFLSATTLEIHHQKHHGGYVKKLDAALADQKKRDSTLDEIILASSGTVFDLAAQVWNHNFYWRSMCSERCELAADGRLNDLITQSFGSMSKLVEQFSEAAGSEFGSGWAWLTLDAGHRKLDVFSTTDAFNPITTGCVPLLTLDVWEHAYYLDYQNERGRYITEFFDGHANWAFAEECLAAADLVESEVTA